MNSSQPTVTVLMPVYNAGVHLSEAIESILGQTCDDFEFLIINDGSTDGSREIIQRYSDRRIRLVENDRNSGLVFTLNRGFAMAQGKYIVRMDQDDYSLPQRLETQVLFMEKNPEVAICGSWMRYIGNAPPIEVPYPTDHEAICCCMLFINPMAHPTVILRTESLLRLGLQYDGEAEFAEDFDLWQRCSGQLRLANIPEVLLHYRISSGSMTHKHAQRLAQTVGRIFARQLAILGVEADDATLEFHRTIGNEIPLENPRQLEEARAHLLQLWQANEECAIYPSQIFRQTLAHYWTSCCDKYRGNRGDALRLRPCRELGTGGDNRRYRHWARRLVRMVLGRPERF
jgi:glycosyltransferase involved in cell wall biosynthesis